MDAFVTRTAPTEKRVKKIQKQDPVLTQLRIEDMRRIANLDTIRTRCKTLQSAVEIHDIIAALKKLEKCLISLEILEESGIGRVIFRLSKHANHDVAGLATTLYLKWRDDAKSQHVQRKRKAESVVGSTTRKDGAKASRGDGFMVKPLVDIEAEMGEWEALAAVAKRRKPQSVPPATGTLKSRETLPPGPIATKRREDSSPPSTSAAASNAPVAASAAAASRIVYPRLELRKGS